MAIQELRVSTKLFCNENNFVFSYDPGSHPVQINYFSSSSVLDGDYDSTGDGSNDVARLLNERRFLFAAIGDEDKECSPNYGN